VYWLRRPPHLRWAIAAAVIVAAAVWDARGPATVEYPFAAVAAAPGTPVDEVVEWRTVPAGVLPDWTGPVGGSVGVALAKGDPLLPSLVAAGSVVPAGWWSVPLELPAPIPPGSPVRVLLGGREVAGVVAQSAGDYQQEALVAFPADAAAAVAAASRDDAIVVMVGSAAFAGAGSG
jgi:hypothetical protein